MRIENSKAVLEVNLNGGSFTDFHLKELPLNPLNWHLLNDPVMPDFWGHFLCFDRWGRPSEGEKVNGFLHHGEVNTVIWTVLSELQINDGMMSCLMMCSLPMGGLQLTRKIEMPENEPVFFVTEEIKNLNKFGRIFNIVQHVTLGPPFLDKSTIFDNNTEKGFENKEDGSLDQEKPVIKWPKTKLNGQKISLRKFENDRPKLSSFIFSSNDVYGWTTACNPDYNIMIGYLWETVDYPWINFWRSMKNGVPVAFGMEFGTTGLHEPFSVLAAKGKIYDRYIFDFIDAGEVKTKSFIAFLSNIPGDYKGVEKIDRHDSHFTIIERSTSPREISYQKK